MKQYIYGEIFIKTSKNLYMIKCYNLCYPCHNTVIYSVYVKCSGYGSIENKTKSNCYGSSDGNQHIKELRENRYLWNEVKRNTWKQAILKRVHLNTLEY
jgi:hypothetical protein